MPRPPRIWIAAILLLSFAACGDLGPSSSTVSTGARHQNGGCPAVLEGAGAPGEVCGKFSDCKEICCSCTSGTKRFAGAACIDNRCASPASACQKAEENSTLVCQ